MHLHHLRLWLGALLCALSCAAMAENAITTDVASVRAGPDDSYPEVTQLDAASPVEVMGCLDDWSWCDVTFDGNRGWLYSPDITYEYQGGYVPFYTYAPAFSVPVISFTVDTYWGSYYHDRPWYRDREQWSHREIQHRPPPGPRPHSGPPPREAVRMDRPHGGPPGDRALRLGRAEPRGSEPTRDHETPDRNTDHADHGDRVAHDRNGDRDRAAPERARDHEGPGSAAHERPQAEHTAPDHAIPDHRDHVAPPRDAPPHAALSHEASHEAPPREAAPRPAPPPMHAPPQHQEPQHAERPHHEEPRPQSNKPQP